MTSLLLARHILERLAAELGQATPELANDARARLAAYRFPGNVRELENILERGLALAAGDQIEADDILLQDAETADETEAEAVLGKRLESVERETIRKALEAHRFNKTRTAASLGLTLRALRYRMQKLGMD